MLIIGAVFFEANSSEIFTIKQGVAQGCILLPTLFLMCMFYYVRRRNPQSWVFNFQKIHCPGLLFADEFVEVAETESALQSLIDIVHYYSKR